MGSRKKIRSLRRESPAKRSITLLRDLVERLNDSSPLQRLLAMVTVQLVGTAAETSDVLDDLASDLRGDLRGITYVLDGMDRVAEDDPVAPEKSNALSLEKATSPSMPAGANGAAQERSGYEQDKEDESAGKPVLTIDHWECLGIGIDEDGAYLAVDSRPKYGDVLPKRKAVELALPGKQWRSLLDLLAKSTNGDTAKKVGVMDAFGYAIAGDTRANMLEGLDGDSLWMREIKQNGKRLTAAISNLSRRLRNRIAVENPGSTKALSVAKPEIVQAGFVVRYLLRDRDGKLRFGRGR
jgi:hypothetical protein